MNRRGDNGRDHPLSCHWRPVAPDKFETLGLPPLKRNAEIARTHILTEAYMIGRNNSDAWVSYSRRREYYTNHRSRYWPRTFTYDAVVPTVDQLTSAGFLDHEKMPSGNRGQQSRFKATTALIDLINREPMQILHDPRERVVLRGPDGELIDYRETRRSTRWRRKIEEINEGLLSSDIRLNGVLVSEGDLLEVMGLNLGVVTNQLHRVFNRGSFEFGGRFYGPWWQNIPSARRSLITINGFATVEMDYPRLHPTLLYAEVDQLMRGDPYDVLGSPRDLTKSAFNTLINAELVWQPYVPLLRTLEVTGHLERPGHWCARSKQSTRR